MKINNIGLDESIKESKATKSAFYLMFPSLISAAIASYFAPMGLSFIAIALALYQFLLLKSFIKDFYNK